MYMGNKNLRGAGEKISMTQEEIQEYIKCKNDILYFAEKYYYIQTIDEGRIKIKLWDYQKKLLKAYENPPNNKRHVILASSRQSGKSESTRVFLLHYLLFKRDSNIAILANAEKTAKEILARIKMSYQLLPLWLQKGVVEGGWNNLTVELENGVRLLASSTSSNSIVGFTVNLLYIDEVSKIPDHIFEEFYSSVLPTISSGKTSKIIMTSSPKGLNSFYNIYKSAVKGENSFYPIKLSWNARPDRTQEWAEEMKKNVTPQQWAQEFLCQFLGSSNTLISGDVLESIDTTNPIDLKFNSALSIFEHPQLEFMYVMGVDTSRGLGSDYSVIQVLKILDERKLEQVAIYRCNTIDCDSFANVCVGVSEYYNDAYMMVENNDIGHMVCDRIWNDHENEKLINYDPKNLGIRSTKKTKFEGNMLLKKYVENNYLKIRDTNTVYELSRYEEVSPNVFHCNTQNGNDDCVTSLIWALYFISTDFYDPEENGRSSKESRDNRKIQDDEKPVFLSSNDAFSTDLSSYSNYYGNMDNGYNNGGGNYFG